MPLGITAPIEPGGVLVIVSPQSVGKEKDRVRHLHAKVWGSTNYASYDELKDVADELLQKEVRNGYVQWCANRAELEKEVGALHLAKIAVVVKGTKVRLIHVLRRNGTNALASWSCSRSRHLVRVWSSSHWISEMRSSSFTWSLRNALSWLEPRWTFSSLITLCCSGLGLGRLCGVGWLRGSCAAPKCGWEADRAQTNCFVDDPIIALRGTASQRRRLAMGVLLWWRALGLKLAYEKGSFGPEAIWIGTHFTVKSVVNKVEISLPAKKNAEILATLEQLMDNARGDGQACRHPKVGG